MIADNIASFFLLFTVIWFFGGLAFFWWLYNRRILQFIKKTSVITKVVAKDLGWAGLLLAPFSIPIVVTAICLYFS